MYKDSEVVESGKKWSKVGEIMEYMFSNTYDSKLDAKARMTLPAKFREKLKENFVLTKGLDRCIELIPYSIWEKELTTIDSLSKTSPKHKAYRRLVMSSTVEAELDSQGRVIIPKKLLEHASIDKEIVIIGNYDKIEIWSRNMWEEYENNFKLEELTDLGF